MLSENEKAYYQAILALKRKDYQKAVENFETAIREFGTNSEFNLLYQSTRLLLEVKQELTGAAKNIPSAEKELIING